MDWERLIPLMIRQMIRQFMRRPGEFLTFRQLAFRIPGADPDVLHALAENWSNLFLITNNDRSLKLHENAVRAILANGLDATAETAMPTPPARTDQLRHERHECDHYTEEEILVDLRRCSVPSDAMLNGCCWRKICRVRGQNPGAVDAECWREICFTRGYLRDRQNPRSF
ncbi:MAG: hypothetical protein L0Z53_06030 [Acidobacteriales bacterium]|nr:hypothetical protein [Terriglobales bacterium]MCI0724816.1 hypothetical protein [Acidobacteriota bacterium]